MTTYMLKKGTYLVGDPAIIFKKNEEGTLLIRKLWEIFYKDMQAFQHLTLDGVELYITRTAEGDGYYQSVGTDSGTIMIICADDYEQDDRLNVTKDRRGMLTLNIADGETVSMERFNLYFSNGVTIITNSDDQ